MLKYFCKIISVRNHFASRESQLPKHLDTESSQPENGQETSMEASDATNAMETLSIEATPSTSEGSKLQKKKKKKNFKGPPVKRQ